jgi:hypothetical protein
MGKGDAGNDEVLVEYDVASMIRTNVRTSPANGATSAVTVTVTPLNVRRRQATTDRSIMTVIGPPRQREPATF